MSAPVTPQEAARLTRAITLASVGVALVLAAIKAVAWIASGSVALLASLADSSLDLIASLITFFAVRYAATPPDAEHRFGHGKAEAFASLVQAGLVFASAALVGREAVGRLLNPEPLRQEGWAIAVMAVSVVLTFALITAQSRVLARTRSVAVSGDRAHYASDLASNLAALAGLAAVTMTGLHWLDAGAGLIVAAILVWSAVGVFREASDQLMDHELPDEDRARIRALAGEDARILSVHHLRTRASGPYLHIQMHLDLDPAVTLEAAHRVLIEAERRVLAAYPAADIIMHLNPHGADAPHGGPIEAARQASVAGA